MTKSKWEGNGIGHNYDASSIWQHFVGLYHVPALVSEEVMLLNPVDQKTRLVQGRSLKFVLVQHIFGETSDPP